MDEHYVAELGDERKGHPVSIPVEVNNQRVVLHQHRETGLQIKEAAIEQAVPIQLGFQLILKRPGEPSRVIGDGETVTVHEGMVFKAIPADDNS
jgi:hypothetical protein